MNAAARAGLLALALAAPGLAQRLDQREATVGMRARIDQLVLPGPELTAKPVTREAPIVLRVLATWPHGSEFRYDLEYYGLDPGRHDLARYLVRKDGTAATGLPEIAVEIRPVLPPGQVEPEELDAVAPPRVGGYRTLQILAGVVWVLGLLALLLVGRRRRAAAAALAARPLTLADRLRPLVEAAAAGRADAGPQAELERLLLAYWRRRLELQELSAAKAIAQLRAHAEAGALLRRLEEWLHRPPEGRAVDVAALLAPYRAVADPEPAPTTPAGATRSA
ncbi:MAG: hypothetical protein IT458_09010 [Planctomycetes bacterium]|nr:hypothetical protein [Planctomycetota bacterium]